MNGYRGINDDGSDAIVVRSNWLKTY